MGESASHMMPQIHYRSAPCRDVPADELRHSAYACDSIAFLCSAAEI